MKLTFPLMFNKRPMYTAEELTRQINISNGSIQCKISFYGYEDFLNGKPVYETTIIDKLLIDCSMEECKTLSENFKKYSMFYIGAEEFYFVIPVDNILKGALKDIAFNMKDKIKKETGLDVKINYALNRMIVMPNTFNVKTKKFVIPVYKEDLEDIGKINELALSQRLE